MKTKYRSVKKRLRRGMAYVIALIFVALFSALSVSFLSMSSANVQTASNHHRANMALNAALSGLECARYVARTTPTLQTGINYVTGEEAATIWDNLCDRLAEIRYGNLTVGSVFSFEDAGGSGQAIETAAVPCTDSGATFRIRFYRYSAAPKTIWIQSTGQDGNLTRYVRMKFEITKSSEVLRYAIAGRGRMWLTGDTTIYGDIYSSWDRASISPFNMTSDSRVEGTINTVLDQSVVEAQRYQMETLDADGHALFEYGVDAYDENGDPLDATCGPADESGYLRYIDDGGALGYAYDENGQLIPRDYHNRVYSGSDEIQGYHENVNYGLPDQDNIPGMDIGDYNTDLYLDLVNGSGGNGSIPASGTIRREYFPHAAGNYTRRRDSASRQLDRHVYEGQTFTNVRLPENRNALFRNCTFNEVLYIDCNKNSSSYYNNVRFENCRFNGVIVTDTPQYLKWKENCLYFTGSATFNNTSSIQEATILAPHFNVNLGDANNGQVHNNDENIITGAIVGGIVDIRGNATIEGTIISMADTTSYTSGYVTNIGATLEDGGSETVLIEDVGTITITPDTDQMLPSGITSPIEIRPVSDSYCEVK